MGAAETGCRGLGGETERPHSDAQNGESRNRARESQSLRGQDPRCPPDNTSQPTHLRASSVGQQQKQGRFTLREGLSTLSAHDQAGCQPSWEGKTFLGRSSFKHLPLMNSLSGSYSKQKPYSFKGKRHTRSRGMNEGKKQKQ